VLARWANSHAAFGTAAVVAEQVPWSARSLCPPGCLARLDRIGDIWMIAI
jgi:hypothetical protein